MSKIMIGIFLGVFTGAIALEVIKRNNPVFLEKLKNKVREKFDAMLEPKAAEI
ncbi:hypothetical protein [Candidatus Magnetomonas plexicatena]|uniref:hypothetical protein n=1 Tax=Candidatus Magnetomonas plexicatena TaxID=2552947 RepID=UPI001C7800CF|nr:hypothetical protein E2O03_011590 [Nitrospirales bacterium LBB_01]